MVQGPRDSRKDTAMSPWVSAFHVFQTGWSLQTGTANRHRQKNSKKNPVSIAKGSGKGWPNNRKSFWQYLPYSSQTSTEILPGFLRFQWGQTASWFFHLSTVLTRGSRPWSSGSLVCWGEVGETEWGADLSSAQWKQLMLWPCCLVSVGWAEWGADLSTESRLCSPPPARVVLGRSSGKLSLHSHQAMRLNGSVLH